MPALYKGFDRFKPVFFGLVLAACLAFTAPALAQYTVEGVEVDVTAANAVKAREEALKQAQVKAFEQLARTTLGEDGMASYTMPDADTVMALVQDFEVTNEQLSARRYKGTFTVRFRPALAQQYLAVRPVVPDYQETADVYAHEQQPYRPAAPSYEQRTAAAPPYPAPQQQPVYQQPAPVYQPAPAAAHAERAVIRARFAGVQEWVRLKHTLERSRAFSLYRIASLQPTEALVELSYTGTTHDLQQAIVGAGLSVAPSQAVVTVNMAAPLFDVGFGGYSRY